MKYEKVAALSDGQFRRLTGLKRQTFEKMIEILTEADRIKKLSDAAIGASPITQKIMQLEAEAKIIASVPNPVFVQPGLGDTSIYGRDESNRLTMFSTKRDQGASAIIDVLNLQSATRVINPLAD